jgi:type IV secretion system protein VirD4
MRDGEARHRHWQIGAALLSAGLLLAALPLIMPLAYLEERGVSLGTLEWVRSYFVSLPDHPAYWLEAYRQWIAGAFARGELPPTLLVPPALALAVLGVAAALNPHDPINAIHGSARWADDKDLKAMKLMDGFVVVLGRWRHKRLKLPETLSALCIAPPGTGKTVSVVVPTILDGDGVSMVINDVKPELHQITSGHRRFLGPVFKLEWAAIDDPERGIVHPRWNPLSPSSVPRPGPERDLYIDRLCSILVADPQGGADPHWSRKGRAALAGLTHYIVCKAEAGNTIGLPARWHGSEASFAMLLDWLTEASLAAGESSPPIRSAIC